MSEELKTNVDEIEPSGNDLINKELLALEDITLYLNANEPKGLYRKNIETIKTALKEKERTEKSIEELFSENGKVITTIEIKNKLKALETIKEILPIEEKDFFYDKETDTYFFIGNKVSKEQYYFLKEVLL